MHRDHLECERLSEEIIVSELMSKVVLDEISDFRPGWDEQAISKMYYKLVSKRVIDIL